jgi:hypothetical protein
MDTVKTHTGLINRASQMRAHLEARLESFRSSARTLKSCIQSDVFVCSSLLNRIPVMVPLTAPLLGENFWGAYFPQKLTPKSSIETEYTLFQKHVPSY